MPRCVLIEPSKKSKRSSAGAAETQTTQPIFFNNNSIIITPTGQNGFNSKSSTINPQITTSTSVIGEYNHTHTVGACSSMGRHNHQCQCKGTTISPKYFVNNTKRHPFVPISVLITRIQVVLLQGLQNTMMAWSWSKNKKPNHHWMIDKFVKFSTNYNLVVHLLVGLFCLLQMVTNCESTRSLSNSRHFNHQQQKNSANSNNGIFIQVPYSSPPTVRPPPYTNTDDICPAMNVQENWVGTLCGDLNSGFVPINPLGHKFNDGSPYPFEMIKNKTLEFFRKSLPILKQNKSLPKVARYSGGVQSSEAYGHGPYRAKRDTKTVENTATISSTELVNSDKKLSNTSLGDQNQNINNIRSKSKNRYAGNGNGGNQSKLPSIAWSDSSVSYETETRARNRGRNNNFGGNGRFCENPSTSSLPYLQRFCKLYQSLWGRSPHNYQRHDSIESIKPSQYLTVATQTAHQQLQQQLQQPTTTAQQQIPKPSVQSHYIKPSFRPVQGEIEQQLQQQQQQQQQIIQQQHQTIKIQPLNNHYHGYHHKKGKNNNFQSEPSNNVPVGLPNNKNLPPTPCPSSAEYLTPVFARNHEGAWRYVVQIPMEGYFTQTVEVTKCLETNCYYMDGSCRSSPRWQSLLVAEMYYPNTVFPTTPPPMPSALIATAPSSTILSPSGSASNTITSSVEPPPISDFNKYQQYLYKRAAKATQYNQQYERISPRHNNDNSNDIGYDQGQHLRPQPQQSSFEASNSSFDGCDDIGCFQIRLFYDWFLIPGSCKCWRNQFDFRNL